MNLSTLDQDDFEIASALRGPDAGSYDTKYQVKKLTTGVIRYFAGMYGESIPRPSTLYGLTVLSPDDAREEWEGMPDHSRDRVRRYLRRHTHFTGHIRMALYALIQKLEGNPRLARELKSYREFLVEEVQL